MLPKQYTQNLIIKHSGEVIRDAELITKNGITSIIQSPESKNARCQIAIPGLINLHCHLAYTNLKIPSQKLFPWIKELVKIQQMGDAQYSSKTPSLNGLEESFNPYQGALIGAKEALSYGTSFIVENSHYPKQSYQALKDSGLKALIGLEVFGSDPEQATEIFAAKISELETLAQDQNIQFTLSPHASYDVSPALWQLCQQWCNQHQVPLLTHIAESKTEEEWFKNKDSDETQSAKEFWQSINTLEVKLKNWRAYSSSIQYLYANNNLNPNQIFTHMIYANKIDLELIKNSNIAMVSCPRSNIYLENGLPDYKLWQELGLAFAIGTDSKASNYNLDLREEVNTIPNLSAKERFELVTSKAASILKRRDLGQIQTGKNSDYVILEILNENIDLDQLDPFTIAMDNKISKVKEVYINGSKVFEASNTAMIK